MKKGFVFAILPIAFGIFWWNKTLFTSILYTAKRTSLSEFTKHKTANLDIYYFAGGLVAADIQEISTDLEKRFEKAARELKVQNSERVNIFLYDNFQQKGAHVRGIQVAHSDPDSGSIHAIYNNDFNGIREGLEYELLLAHGHGKAASPRWSRAAAVSFSNVWNQKTLDEWQQFLVNRDLLIDLEKLSNDQTPASDFIVFPWSAIAARLVREQFGFSAFLTLYRDGRLPAEFRTRWEQYARNLPPKEARWRPAAFIPQFQKGISYAYWNSVNDGYATENSQRSLDLLKESGVEWIASIPFGFMRDHDSPEVRRAGHSIITENDESLFVLANDARARGMRVMLKPQIWISHDAWPGKVNMDNAEMWNRWFASYEDWIIHYAIIAELSGASLFCIGTELVQTTLKHPERWRKIIARIRGVYSGPLVYAANWGKEFEQITFWDSLDYIGLDNYYPVRSSTEEGPHVMIKQFAKQKEMLHKIAKRWNKPVLFTEIGYMAMDGAGMGSNEDDYPRYNEKMQEECYRAAMQTYWNEPWFAGMYWWKWFSNPHDRGKQADEHSPHGRRAQQVMAEYYKNGSR